MPALTRKISKQGIDAAADAFQLSAEQRAYIDNTYINTGKMTEEKTVAGSAPGALTSVTLTHRFSSLEDMQEYMADPQIQAIKAQADSFYAARGVTPQRSADFN